MTSKTESAEVVRLREELKETKQELERLRGMAAMPENGDFGQVWEDTKSGYWEWNGNSKFPLASDTFKRILGYDGEDLDGSFWRRHVYQEDLPKIFRIFERHVQSKGQHPLDLTLRFKHRNGHTLHVWGRGKVINWGSDGTPSRIVGTLVDITDLIESKAVYKDTWERLDLIVDGTEAGLWDWKLQENKVWWSDKHYELLGYKPGEIESSNHEFFGHIYPDDVSLVENALQNHLEKRVPFKEEFRMVRKDKSLFWAGSTGQAAFDDNGKPVRIAGGLVDITDRKELELKLRTQNLLFREAEKLVGMGAWEYDVSTGVANVTKEMYKLREMPESEPYIVEEVTKIDPPESRLKIQKGLQNMIENGEPYDLEVLIGTYTGKKIWVHSKGVPVYDNEGKLVKIRGVVQNIDEKKRREIELDEIREKLSGQVNLLREAEKVADLGSWEFDIATSKVVWSEQTYKINRVPMDFEPTLEYVMQSYLEESRERLEQAIKEAVEESKEYELDLRMKTYTGEVVWVRAKGIPVKDDSGKVTGLTGVTQDIDKYKKQEEELKKTEYLYSEAARIGKVGAWEINARTMEITWSKEIYHLLEVSEDYNPSLEEAMDFYDGESKEKLTESIDAAITEKRPFSENLHIKTKTGRTLWLRAEGSPIFFDDGEVRALRGSIQDITDLKEKELHLEKLNTELAQQRAALLQAEEIAKLGSWIYRFDGTYSMSDQVYRIHEIPKGAEGALQQEVEHYYKDYKEEVETCVERVRNGESYSFDAYITAFDKQHKWVRIKASPLRAKGQIVGVTGTVQDIHDFKEAEESLREAQEQLHKQNFILLEAKRMAKIGSWQWESAGEKFSWSDQLRDIFDVPKDYSPSLGEWLGRFYDEETSKYLRKCIRSAAEDEATYDFQTRISSYCGNQKWVRIKGSPMYREDGSLKGVFGTVQDISDIKEKELEVQRASDLLSEQNKRLMDFTQIVSHNLRSHSSNIQTMLNFVQKNNNEEERETYYTYIKETADSLQHAINHLNEVVKIQKDVNLKKDKINIETCLEEVLHIMEGDIRLYDVEVNFDLQVTRLRYVKAYFDSILLNLVSNAIKYRHPHRTPMILIKTYRNDDGRPVLEVQDNGQGIDLEKHGQKIFGMYKTFHKHPEARGIGLFIIKNQIEALKGSIEIESTVGEGSTFRVVF